jgi:hypothetical protein
MMELLTTGETPHMGWRHKEAHSGIEFPIEKGTMIFDYGALVKMVMEHRKGTGGDLDIGWEGRFQDELCQEHPEYPCKYIGDPSERRLTLNDVKQFLHTASKFIDSGSTFVDQETATKRALICSRCPLNQEVAGCIGCSRIMEAVDGFLLGHHTPHDPELKSCGVCGCVNKVKVWMPDEALTKSDKYPEWCWQYEQPEPTN